MTNRSVLRAGKFVAIVEMLPEDQPLFHKWLSESEVLRSMIDDPRVPTLEDQQLWFERSRQPDRRMFSIVTLSDYTLIGNGGFVQIDPEAHTGVFRITLGNTAAWGKGYGSEATTLLLKHGFETMGLQTLSLRVRKDNERAMRLYGKFGFNKVAEEAGVLTMSLPAEKFLSLHA